MIEQMNDQISKENEKNTKIDAIESSEVNVENEVDEILRCTSDKNSLVVHCNNNVKYAMHPNYQWSGCLLKILMHADMSNYLMASLSTLGGAYHLCNHPKIALNIANRTLFIGHMLGSTKIIIKAHTYRAINYAMLGDYETSLAIINRCVELTGSHGSAHWTGMHSFCHGTLVWIENYMKLHPVSNLHTRELNADSRRNLERIEN